MTAAKSAKSKNPMEYIVVSGRGEVYGTYATKAEVCKFLNKETPIRAYIAKQREDGGYDRVAEYSVAGQRGSKFTF